MDDEALPTTSPDDAEWLPIRAAARRLGVTPTAIRKRIERGTLTTKPNGNRGFLVRIPVTVTVTADRSERSPLPGTLTVSGDPAEEGRVTVSGDPAVMVTVTALLARIADLEAKVADRDAVAGQVEALRATLDAVTAERDRWHEATKAAWARSASVPIVPKRRSWLPWRRAG